MRIMGIDASPSTTGIAIYDTEDAKDFILVTKIRTSIKKATPTLGKRVDAICTEISHLLFWHAVDVVVAEDVFINQLSAGIPLAILRGAIQTTAYDLGYEQLHVIEASVVKKAVTDNGRADKPLVYDTVKELYKHSPIVQEALGDELISKDNASKNEDMADAIAVVHAYLTNPSLAHPA